MDRLSSVLNYDNVSLNINTKYNECLDPRSAKTTAFNQKVFAIKYIYRFELNSSYINRYGNIFCILHIYCIT